MNRFWLLALVMGVLSCVTLFSACEDDDMGPIDDPCCELAPIDFEDHAPGTNHPNGTSFTTQGQKYDVLDFTWSNGGITSSGMVMIRDTKCLNPGGVEAQLNNVNIKADLPAEGVSCISFKAVNKGGNLNLTINNQFLNFSEASDIDGTMQGGVMIEASGANDVAGLWKFTGNITDFQVGGQELFVDDWCIEE
ncbi:MAG: hypothetical protein AAFY48_11570 [Bacteroidota bacterium]